MLIPQELQLSHLLSSAKQLLMKIQEPDTGKKREKKKAPAKEAG